MKTRAKKFRKTRAGSKPKQAPEYTLPQHIGIMADGVVDLVAAESAEGEDAKPSLRKFSILAYTGGKLAVRGFPYPVIVDLAGCRLAKGQLPLLRDHDIARVLGHATDVKIGDVQINIEAVVSGTGQDAREVIEAADNDFQWKASIGARVVRAVFVRSGQSVTVNNKTFRGPIYVARKSVLREISIVAIGADERAEARLAARGDSHNKPRNTEVLTMEFEQWLQANGWTDFEDMSEAQQQVLRAAYEASQRDEESDDEDGDDPQDGGDVNARISDALTRERQRVSDIEAMCDGEWGEADDQVTDLRAQAMDGRIDNDTLARKLLNIRRSSRPGAPAVQTRDRKATSQVIEAAACMSAMVPTDILEASYSEEVLNRASEQYTGLGLRGVIHLAAMSEGNMLPEFTTNPGEWIRAAFSSMTLPGILSNVAQKKLEEGFNYGDKSWEAVAKTGSVSDFKPHKRFRMLSDMTFQPVGPDGELKDGMLSETDSQIQADTHGVLFGITRKMLVNDDLGAFLQVPEAIGMGWNDAISDAVWTLWLSNAGSFFSSGNKNYLTGADTALSVAGLTKAVTQFKKQTKPKADKRSKARPLGLPPKILLTPPELETLANLITTSQKVNNGGDGDTPADNPHAGKYTSVSSPYLSQDGFHDNVSSKAWYLLADPKRLPAIEVAFLNGRRKPFIEQSDQAFNVLGKQFRGYGDFGVALMEHEAALKSKGEA